MRNHDPELNTMMDTNEVVDRFIYITNTEENDL